MAARVDLCVAAAALLTIGLAAQQPRPYSERVEVSRVLIDARVLDDENHAIGDLGPDDFTVKIGGKPARVESVEFVSGMSGGTAAPVLDSTALDIGSHQTDGRLIVFVFQKSLERSRIVGFMRMLIKSRGLLDTLTPRDRVAVLSFDSHLQVWLDFTNDFDRVRRVFTDGILFTHAGPVQESAGLSLVRRLDQRRASRTYSIERALLRLGEALEYLPGVKSVVLIGHGFGRLNRSGVSMENDYDPMRDALQRARASVFALDVTDADYHSLEAGLQLVASDTGGFFARTHIFTDLAMQALTGALSGHYVLFVEEPPLKRGTHGIEVKLTRRKGRVFANRTHVITTRDQTADDTKPSRSSESAVPSCRATPPPDPAFVPPAPYPPRAPFADGFWYGTQGLWTMLPANGQWKSLPKGDYGYRQKLFLWRPGYDGRSEQWPRVSVTGRRIDGPVAPLVVEEATNAFHRDFGGWAMLSGIEVPSHGCWEMTATYGGASLTFVVSVTP